MYQLFEFQYLAKNKGLKRGRLFVARQLGDSKLDSTFRYNCSLGNTYTSPKYIWTLKKP